MYSTRGTHILLDMWGVDFDILNNKNFLNKEMNNSANIGGATVLYSHSVEFKPNGVTSFLVLSESHISAHTYPDDNFVAFDIYTCGDHVDTEKMAEYLISIFSPKTHQIQRLERGIIKN